MRNWINYVIILLILIIGGVFFYQYHNKMNEVKEINKQNISALTDSIKKVKNKNNSLIFDKAIYDANLKELKHLNKELTDKTKILEKELKGNVKTISTIQYITNTDTTYIPTPKIIYNIPDSSLTQNWKWSNEWNELEGINKIYLNNNNIRGSVSITNNKTKISLTTGIYDDNGIKRIYVKSDNPNVQIIKLDGAILEEVKTAQKTKRLGFGLYGGYGINYNPNDNRVTAGPQIGIGIIWKIF